MDPHRQHLERRNAARHSLFRLRRRPGAAVHRQPGVDPAAHLGESRRLARAAGLVRARSRPEGGALSRRDSHGAGAPPPVRVDRPAELCEDHREDGAPYTPVVRPPVYICSIPYAGRAPRPVRLARARRCGDDRSSRHEAWRQSVSRLSTKSARADDRRAVQRAAPAGGNRLHATAMGRSRGRARSARLHDQDRPRPHAIPNERSVRRGSRAEARFA